jgi:cell division septation protein DedD
MFDGNQTNLDSQPPEESSNRTFLIAAGLLGGIVLIALACLAGVYFFSVLPSRGSANAAAASQATQNAQIQRALTATQMAFSLATATALPTDTPVLAEASATPTPQNTNTPDPATATVAAALTQAAVAQLTIVPTSTALPKTGIADQYGAPGLVIVTMVFIGVIFLARRLRTTPMK